MNDHDMERMKAILTLRGHLSVADTQDADVVIVNTCCVREKAEQKFYSLMGRLRRIKKRKGIILGVTGCVAQLEKEGIRERIPFIDFALGPSNVHMIAEAVENATEKEPFFDFSENGNTAQLLCGPGKISGSVKASVTIMKGCNNFCTYCVVPYVRGREASRPSRDIIEEITDLAAGGVKEVTLLGQNVNSYNNGCDDMTFPELLKEINNLSGIERIRFVTSHPKDLSSELINCFGTLSKLCESIHLPFQSGSDRILQLMNRGYTRAGYIKKVRALQEQCKGIAITADCIVGFPGEREEEFQDTLHLIKEIGFDNIFSFAYSPRKFTKAAALPYPVPAEVALERLRIFQEYQKLITIEKNKALEGSIVEVLVDGFSKNSAEDLTGRTRTHKIVNFKGNGELMHKLVEVEIIKGYANSLRGENPRVTGGMPC